MKQPLKHIIVVIILGDYLAGKTIVSNYLQSREFEPTSMTLGVDINPVNIEDEAVNVILAELAVGPKDGFKKTRDLYYQSVRKFGNQSCIVVYDITNKSSFENVSLWVDEYQTNVEESGPITLIGTKLDLVQTEPDSRSVTYEEGFAAAKRFNAFFYEIDVKNSEGGAAILREIAAEVLKAKSEGKKNDKKVP